MLEQLKIYDVKSPKVRLGNEWDGGYVLPELMLNESKALFTYGVGNDVSFEVDYINKTNNNVYLFDHTIDKITVSLDSLKSMVFKKEGLSYEKTEKLDTFFNHYNENKIDGRVLLKIDIEGDEFQYFLKTDIEKLSKLVTGIVVEFHPTEIKVNINNFFEALEKLNKYFYNCHIHANNYGGTVKHVSDGMNINLPHIIEMTFINKEIFLNYNNGSEPNLDMGDFPTIHDRKNDLNRPDISLEFLKDINNLKPQDITQKINAIDEKIKETQKQKLSNMRPTSLDSRMIYISLSTVPIRLNLWDIFRENLESLLNQDTKREYKVILNIPLFYKNNNNEEYKISKELLEFAEENPKLIINRVINDYGPVVKITGALQYVRDLNSVLIVCDDDHIYHKDMLEYHIKKLNQYPESIICFRGDDCVDKRYWFEDGVMKYCLLPTHFYFPVKYDMQLIRPGHWHSVGYRREYFNDDFLDESFLSMATNDDILTGYYFKLRQRDFICVAWDGETDFRPVNGNNRPPHTFPIVDSLPFPSSGFEEFRIQCGHHMGAADQMILNEFQNNHDKIYIKNMDQVTYIESLNSYNNSEFSLIDKNRRVIVTMTTIPSRLHADYDSGIKSNLNSLINQDYNGEYEIHLNIPEINKNTGVKYVIPDWLRHLAIENPKLKIFEGIEDLGTMTKLVPTLKRVSEPDAIIIVCDDDLVYHPKMVEEQVKNQLTYVDTACGYDGGLTKEKEFDDERNHFVVSVPRDIEVRVLQHYKTISYQRYFFKDDLYEDFLDASWNDDISISAYIGKHGYRKLVRTYDGEEKLETLEQWRDKGGVLTFPVLSHTSHEGQEGCWHYRSKGVSDNHEKYISLGWI